MSKRRHWAARGCTWVVMVGSYAIRAGGVCLLLLGYRITPVEAANLLAVFEDTLQRLYAQVNPSVVNIRVVQEEDLTYPSFPDRRSGVFDPSLPQGSRKLFRQGSASGFVWDVYGHVVTNHHVIADTDRLSVTFHDGATVPGRLVGADAEADLAVIKVDVPVGWLRPVAITDSTQLKVGQLAVAIGNPFGLKSTMTVGFISALGRLLPVESDGEERQGYSIPDVIQTDASINPGNSGGVLVDSQSRVIGVTSAIISPVGVSVGIGFAIPSVIVQKIVPVLIRTGQYEHAWLGVSGYALTPELAASMGLPATQRGALIVDVAPGSPADRVGLYGSGRQAIMEGEPIRLGGDVIVAIDHQPVQGFDHVSTYLVRATEVGQRIALDIIRQGKEMQVSVTLAARPRLSLQQRRSETDIDGGVWLGIQGLTVVPQIAEAMQLPAAQRGVLVEQVFVGGPADRAGVRGSYKPLLVQGEQVLVGGDIITAVDNQPLLQMEDLLAFMQQAQPHQKMVLSLLRHGKSVLVTVTLTAPSMTLP